MTFIFHVPRSLVNEASVAIEKIGQDIHNKTPYFRMAGVLRFNEVYWGAAIEALRVVTKSSDL